MNKITLTTLDDSFEVFTFKATQARALVLFAVGRGGDPARHESFEKLVSPRPSATEVLVRAERIKTTIDHFKNRHLPLLGVGHSIGATLLLALAGGQMWMSATEQLPIVRRQLCGDSFFLLRPPVFFKHRGL